MRQGWARREAGGGTSLQGGLANALERMLLPRHEHEDSGAAKATASCCSGAGLEGKLH